MTPLRAALFLPVLSLANAGCTPEQPEKPPVCITHSIPETGGGLTECSME